MAPACNLAEQALREFDAAIEILHRGTVGTGARRILVSLFWGHKRYLTASVSLLLRNCN